MDKVKYTSNVGRTFNADGSVRHYPGNTIICHCYEHENAYKQVAWVHEQFKQQTFAHKYTLLPLSSLHMTVFPLLCEQERKLERWSSKLALDTNLCDTDTFFLETIPRIPVPENFWMAYKLFWKGGAGFSIRLQTANKVSKDTIWHYRNEISRVTGVRYPNHELYEFHISLAYQIIELDSIEEEKMQKFSARVGNHLSRNFRIFNSSKPCLSFFDNMFEFVDSNERHLLLSRQINETKSKLKDYNSRNS